ncbi:argininosuccinate synthase [Natronospira proteinivora]|uniref:argininosuccinate synthase n=1 Tax=Natronospira proteinivora TaxID=1807133 RepID=A0ABT1GBW2_9GAMM|nr:argininosuccinate synthase [Natronospira proteinivora]MCP1727778.1 argininosuccinate synthase [Natronospira proteinivora]
MSNKQTKTHKGDIVLAFSGGLDTSYCAVWLQEQGWAVHTVTVDTGGFDTAELADIEASAKRAGVAGHTVIDARPALFDRFLRFLIYGNVLRGDTYPLCVSAERVCQAEAVAEHALALGAKALAHGSTGAGNDQIRFDVAFQALAPDLPIITPIRDQGLSRQQEVDYLAGQGIHVPESTGTYSVNQGLWGTTVGGRETLDSWPELPEAAYPGGRPKAGPEESRDITLSFEQGVPVALDGESLAPVALIESVAALAGHFGIGRGVHLGDTILGIKGRVGFEAGAAALLIPAHRELEKLVLSGKQLFWKSQLGDLYGSLIHEGQAYDPLVKDLEAFLSSSQQRVTGEVRLRLQPRAVTVLGQRSPHSLMDANTAAYGEANHLWSGDDARGFARVFGVAQRLSATQAQNAKPGHEQDKDEVA